MTVCHEQRDDLFSYVLMCGPVAFYTMRSSTRIIDSSHNKQIVPGYLLLGRTFIDLLRGVGMSVHSSI